MLCAILPHSLSHILRDAPQKAFVAARRRELNVNVPALLRVEAQVQRERVSAQHTPFDAQLAIFAALCRYAFARHK